MSKKQKNIMTSRGFTLIEMTVSLGLFTIIMFIATSSFLSIVNADRKSRAVRIATDNLNVALEDMSRRIKTGMYYYCGASGGSLHSVGDCVSGLNNTTLFFDDQNGQRVKYTLDTTTHAIMRSVGAEPLIRVTSPEANITTLNFLVSGSAVNPDKKQPIVVVAIGGTFGAGETMTTFKIQTAATQRAYDN